MNSPLSIVIVCYNSEAFVERSINSALHSPHNVVLIDDGSEDGTLNILKKYTESRQVRLLLNKHHEGLGVCLNRAILSSKSPYIAVQADRDISPPERFELQMEAIEENTSVGLVASHAAKIDDHDRITGHISYPPDSASELYACILQNNISPVLDQTIMFRRNLVEEMGGFNTRYSLCTFELVCRMLPSGVLIRNIQKPLVFTRATRLKREDRQNREYERQFLSAQFARGNWTRTLKMDKSYFLQDCFTEFVYSNRSEEK